MKKNLSSLLTLILFISLAFLISCGQAEETTTAQLAPTSDIDITPIPTSNENCKTSVVDRGNKGATSRGLISSVKLNPVDGLPAFAYLDSAALSLRFSYKTGSSYIHEVISGYPATVNNLDMIFLSTGIPVVMWTANGTDVLMAIRSAALPEVGTWNVRFLSSATGFASRAISLSVNSADQVIGVFLSNTAITGRAKSIICKSDCENLSQYQAMDTANFIENTAIVAAQVYTGVSWCKADTNADGVLDAQYPVAVYGGNTNQVRYAICRQGNLNKCLLSSNWASTSVVASANVGSKVIISQDTLNATATIVSRSATGLVTYVMSNPCHLAPNLGTFTASGPSFGTATTGTLWLNFLRGNDGRYHVVTNDAATSIKYFNTDNSNQWNTGATLNSVASGIAGQGGADIDLASNKIFSTHYPGIATYKFNFLLNEIANTELASSNALLNFSNQWINTDGHIELTTANVENISLQTTNDGRAAAAYVDFSAGAANTGVLKYAFRSGTSINSSWNVTSVSGGTAAQNPTLRFDSQNRPWISYYDSGTLRFYLLKNSAFDGSGTWQSYIFPAYPTGAAVAVPASNSTALVIYQNAGVDYVVMGIIDSTNTVSNGVKVARFNAATSAWTTPSVVEILGATRGSNLKIVKDSSFNIAVSYKDLTTGFIKYSASSDGITWTTPIAMNMWGAGQGLQLAVDSDGHPLMTYIDRANNRIYKQTCSDSLINCALSAWSPVLLDLTLGVSTFLPANDLLLKTDIVFHSSGAYDILYNTGMTVYGGVRKMSFDASSELDSFVEYITGFKPYFSSTFNFGVAGLAFDSEITSNDQLVSVYIGEGNLLYQKSCEL